MADKLPPTHPGEILREDFMEPLGLNSHQLAKAVNVPPNRITQIVNGQRAVSADTALRLAHCFPGVSAQFWLKLQAKYDLALLEDEQGTRIAREVVPQKAANQQPGTDAGL